MWGHGNSICLMYTMIYSDVGLDTYDQKFY